MKIVQYLIIVLVSCGTKKFSVEALYSDLNFIDKSLREVHPKLFSVTDSISYNNSLNSIRDNIDKPLNEHEWFMRVAPLVSSIGDGHTRLLFPNKTRIRGFLGGSKVSPFSVVFIGDELYVADDLSKTEKSIKGYKILKINGQGINDIINKMIPYIYGKSIQFRKSQIESSSWGRIFYENLGYSGDYLLSLENIATGELIEVKRKGITQMSYYNRLAKCSDEHRKVLLTKLCSNNVSLRRYSRNVSLVKVPEHSLGVIRYSNFFGKIDSIPLKNVFDTIRKLSYQNLVFDLRGNAGGSTNFSNEILSYFTKKNIAIFSKGILKLSQQYMSTKKNSDFTSRKNVNIGDTICYFTSDSISQAIDNPLRFEGNIFVLCNNSSFSTASSFCASIQDYKLATLVGEEPGGFANSYGDPLFLKLPHTGLSLLVSTKFFYRSNPNLGSLINPDLIVKRDYQSIFNNTDKVLIKVINYLIKKNEIL